MNGQIDHFCVHVQAAGPLYVYNMANPANDFRVNETRQVLRRISCVVLGVYVLVVNSAGYMINTGYWGREIISPPLRPKRPLE